MVTCDVRYHGRVIGAYAAPDGQRDLVVEAAIISAFLAGQAVSTPPDDESHRRVKAAE
jgi:hypothetical protein